MRVGVRLLSTPAFGALAAATLFCVAAACSQARNGADEAEHRLTGRVIVVDAQPGMLQVRVEDETEPREFVLLVGPGVRIERRHRDGTPAPGRREDLVPGVRIEAEHTGAELRSLAPRYEATRIRILPEP